MGLLASSPQRSFPRNSDCNYFKVTQTPHNTIPNPIIRVFGKIPENWRTLTNEGKWN